MINLIVQYSALKYIYLYVNEIYSNLIILNISAIGLGVSISIIFQPYSHCGTVSGMKIQICK